MSSGIGMRFANITSPKIAKSTIVDSPILVLLTSRSFKGKWTDSGLVIFSRLPVAETRSIRFASGAALDAGACKGHGLDRVRGGW